MYGWLGRRSESYSTTYNVENRGHIDYSDQTELAEDFLHLDQVRMRGRWGWIVGERGQGQEQEQEQEQEMVNMSAMR